MCEYRNAALPVALEDFLEAAKTVEQSAIETAFELEWWALANDNLAEVSAAKEKAERTLSVAMALRMQIEARILEIESQASFIERIASGAVQH